MKSLDPISLKDLRALLLLSEIGHFGKTAALCGLTQPGLSALVKKVEGLLDRRLFERSSKGDILTSAGVHALGSVRAAFNELGALTAPMQSDKPLSGQFRLGLIPTISPFYVPKLIRPLLKRFPKLELVLTEDKTSALFAMLLENKIESAILALPIDDSRLGYEFLFQEELLLVVPKKHKLARKKTVSVSDLDEQELLLMEQGHCLRNQILESCGPAGLEARTVHGTGLETLLHMVQLGAGYTIVPQMALKALRSHQGLSVLRFKQPRPSRTIGIVFRKSSSRLTDIQALCAFLRSER